jgi:hypothetical protein
MKILSSYKSSLSIKVATVAVLLSLVPNFQKHLVMVWFCFVLTEPENHFSKILQHFSEILFQIS